MTHRFTDLCGGLRSTYLANGRRIRHGIAPFQRFAWVRAGWIIRYDPGFYVHTRTILITVVTP